jgi:outer membrane protein OmpA-like peptidoglycan-associated protein
VKQKVLSVLLVFLIKLSAFSSPIDTIRIYYKIGKEQLTPTNQLKLDSLSSILTSGAEIRVLGYADLLGNAENNVLLSKDRAEAVKLFFAGKKNKDFRVFAAGMGEVQARIHDKVFGEPYNRRVDVIFSSGISQKKASLEKENVNSYTQVVPSPVVSNEPTIKDLANLQVGESITFRELNFQGGRHFLTEESMPFLDSLLTLLTGNPNLKIEIQGHICCYTNTAHNDGLDVDTKEYQLSRNRAKYIYDYLVMKGVKSGRMRYRGFGFKVPKRYPEVTTKDQDENRRVEIILLGK